MAQNIFFSWQSDTPGKIGKFLIIEAIQEAISDLKASADIHEALREELDIDHDTRKVAGSPPIVDTIFKKIDAATVFIADATFVGKRMADQPTPNPNVLIEYGWALRALTHERVICVMNTAYGRPDGTNLPFDMRHLRFPILFHLEEGADKATRDKARKDLVRVLKDALMAVLTCESVVASIPAPVPFKRKAPQQGSARFWPKGKPIGVFDPDALNMALSMGEVNYVSGPAYWLRIWPKYDQGKIWALKDVKKAAKGTATQRMILPIGSTGSFNFVRLADGWGIFGITAGQEATNNVVVLFTNGELWAVDSRYAQYNLAQKQCVYSPELFAQRLPDYVDALRSLGVTGPLEWEAGMDEVSGFTLSRPNARPLLAGPCLQNPLIASGEIGNEAALRTNAEPVLKSLDEVIKEAFGVLH